MIFRFHKEMLTVNVNAILNDLKQSKYDDNVRLNENVFFLHWVSILKATVLIYVKLQ